MILHEFGLHKLLVVTFCQNSKMQYKHVLNCAGLANQVRLRGKVSLKQAGVKVYHFYEDSLVYYA